MAEKKCYGWKGLDGGGNLALFIACADNPGWEINPMWVSLGDYGYPTDNGINIAWSGYGATSGGITLLNNEQEISAWANGRNFAGNCQACMIPFTTHCESEKKSRVIVGAKEYTFDAPIQTRHQDGKLTIKDKNNKQFKVSSAADGYLIACGDECPPGHIKCKHNGYPGYCCIPCQSTADKINNLANKLRG